MILRFKIRPPAQADITEAYTRYKRRSPDAGSAFLRALDDRIESILRYPSAYPIVYGPARRALVSGFPYALYFIPLEGLISVIACTHTLTRSDREQITRMFLLTPLLSAI